MTEMTLKLALPDALAREAEAAGLLTADAIVRLLREEMRRQRAAQLFAAADRLAGLNIAPLSDAEVEAEIQAARDARRS